MEEKKIKLKEEDMRNRIQDEKMIEKNKREFQEDPLDKNSAKKRIGELPRGSHLVQSVQYM